MVCQESIEGMRGFSVSNYLVLLCIFLIGVASITNGCSCGESDARLFADVRERTERAGVVTEITFQRELSECVNGMESRGFAWADIRVDRPSLNGEPLALQETETATGTSIKYLSLPHEVSTRTELSFQQNGKVYTLDESTGVMKQGFARYQMVQTDPR
jgi:hypothetical protein